MSVASVLGNLIGDYGDDIAKAAAKSATNKVDDIARVIANKSDDVARAASSKIDDSAKVAAKNLLSPEQEAFFKNSVVRDSEGNLKTVYHGSPNGKFSIFNRELSNPEGDWGKGFYFTDNEDDVLRNYFGGGPDFDNKVARKAEELENELGISYDQAEKRARDELYKGKYKIDAYLNMENPATVGKTTLLDGSEYPVMNLGDFENIDDYYSDLIYNLGDDVVSDLGLDYDYADKIRNILYDSYYNGGIGLQELKDALTELYIEDYDGALVSNEVARSILENLGFDGIIDPTVSSKFKHMGLDNSTTHYITFLPNQIKNIKNKKPTSNSDIFLGLGGVLGGGSILGSLLSSANNKERRQNV